MREKLTIPLVASIVLLLAGAGATVVMADVHSPDEPGSFIVDHPSPEDAQPGYQEADYQMFAKMNDPATEENFGEYEEVQYTTLFSPDIQLTCGPEDVRVAGFDRGDTHDGTQTDETISNNLKSSGTHDDWFWVEFYKEEDVGPHTHWDHDDELVTWFADCYTNPDEPMWTQWEFWMQAKTYEGETEMVRMNTDWIYICDCSNLDEAVEELGPPPTAEDEAEITFEDPSVRAGAVTVDEVSMSHGGFVAIYTEEPSSASSDDIIGVTSYLEHGDHSDVSVVLDEEPEEGQTLYAVPHQDTSKPPQQEVPDEVKDRTPYPDDTVPSTYKIGTEEFKYADSGEEVDQPYTDGGDIVFSAAEAEISESEEAFGDVTFNDQDTEGDEVVVSEVTVSEGGFVAIYSASSGPTADGVYGVSEYLEDGSHTDVSVPLEEPVEDGEELVAVAHQDTTGSQAFEYDGGDTDAPYEGAQDTAQVNLLAPVFAVSTVDATAGREPGETFSIEAEVQNTGGLEGTETVEITFDGETLISEEVSLAPGESQTFSESFEVDQEPGTYTWTVSVGEASETGEFNVLDPDDGSTDGSDGDGDGDGDEDGDGDGDGDVDGGSGGPGDTPEGDGNGFTVLTGLLGVVAYALYARRRL